MAIWQSCIAKYLLAIWLYFIFKCMLEIWRHLITKHMLTILATSYHLKMIELVAFIGLEGVNYVFSHVSLNLVTTVLF